MLPNICVISMYVLSVTAVCFVMARLSSLVKKVG